MTLTDPTRIVRAQSQAANDAIRQMIQLRSAMAALDRLIPAAAAASVRAVGDGYGAGGNGQPSGNSISDPVAVAVVRGLSGGFFGEEGSGPPGDWAEMRRQIASAAVCIEAAVNLAKAAAKALGTHTAVRAAVCTVDNCGEYVHARGLCPTHYRAELRRRAE